MAVSSKFRELAAANGRHVRCRIRLGDRLYDDGAIVKFDLTDVTHPDWFTIGTTCSNVFSFKIVNDIEPPLHTTVRPYISFDGEEWAQLGVFYVARRLFRGKYATYVCYDKMNDLNVEITEKLTVSQTSSSRALLKAVCEQAGIEFKGEIGDHKTFLPPPDTTIKQIIGYIAALNCACAKFDKDGYLVFRKYSQMPTARLSAKNCFKVNLNITRAAVTGLRADTGTETLLYGDRDRMATLELRNPFMTQSILQAIGRRLSGLYFYGGEIDMQGLPFLDSGELILFEDADGSLTPIVMSEIAYHYDGALTAKLFSKNKYINDPPVGRAEFEDEIAKLWQRINSIHRES